MHKLIDNRYTLVAVLALFALGIAPAVDAAVDAKVKITHKAEKKVPSGERIPLSVGIKDKEHAIELVRTYFKAKEGSKFYFVAMRLANGNTYAGMLPALACDAESLEYFFLVKTDSVVKSQNFVVPVECNDAAAKRMAEQPARDIQSPLDEVEELTEDLSSEPSEGSRVSVFSPDGVIPAGIKGVDDWISMTPVAAGARLGAAAATSTVAASSGIGAAGIAGIALGAAALGGGGGSSSSSGSVAAPPEEDPPDGTVSSLIVDISVIDINVIQDDFYDLFVNGTFIGPVNNPPGGTTTYKAVKLQSGSNLIELRLTEIQNCGEILCGTFLQINVNNGEFTQDFGGTMNHSWTIVAP